MQVEEEDLIVVDYLIGELEKLEKKNKCSSCTFWKTSSDNNWGFCTIGKNYFIGTNSCPYGTWKLKERKYGPRHNLMNSKSVLCFYRFGLGPFFNQVINRTKYIILLNFGFKVKIKS